MMRLLRKPYPLDSAPFLRFGRMRVPLSLPVRSPAQRFVAHVGKSLAPLAAAAAALVLLVPVADAQQPPPNRGATERGAERERATLSVEEYAPVSTLRVPGEAVTRARFPFVDVHGHQGGVRSEEHVRILVSEMDELNMAVMVNLSGGSGEALIRNRESLQRAGAENRFVVFANLDFRGVDDPEWGARAADQLERDVKEGGASGLKIFKNLGMDLTDGAGNRIPTDDPRFDPVWARAGQLGIPVLIHTGEPIAFFDPIDETNERWLELTQFPNRARPAARYPSWEVVMGEQHNVFRKHPGTNFINAHLGWMGNDLGRLGALLDELPNMHVELGAVIYEIGRQPRFAHDFFERYQDRILMGKDSYNQEEFHVYFRIFETEDEYFDYYRRRHAFWQMYGMGLSDAVLRKVYFENAVRLIPGIDVALFPMNGGSQEN